MRSLIIKSSVIAAVCITYSSFSFTQHSQSVHEKLVDDFYTPYLFSLKPQQTFTGFIGESKRIKSGDSWDYFVFHSPASGEIDIVLENFDMPVNLSLESSFPADHKKPEALAESLSRFTDSHQISANVAPLTTYYIAVGAGVPGNGYTPYTLTVKFKESEVGPESASPVTSGDYELTVSGEPCAVPGFEFSDLNLPVYVVSGEDAQLTPRSKSGENIDARIHEMFRFDPTYGMLVHEFSDVVFDEESEASLQRDIVVVGKFEDGEFHGTARHHGIVKSASQEFVKETGSCSRQVTAIGK